jgi:hypothetical protein
MCYVTNGTQQVRLVARQIYKEEIPCFDGDMGVFVAVTEQGLLSAESWNSQKDLLAEYLALCRHNHNQMTVFTVQRCVSQLWVTITKYLRSTFLDSHL